MKEQPFLSRITYLFFVLSVLILALGGRYYRSHLHNTLHDDRKNELRAIADLKVDLLTAWNQERLSDAAIHSSGLIRTAILDGLDDPDPGPRQALLASHWRSIQREYDYDNVLLIGPDGELLFNLEPDLPVVEPEALDLARRAIESGHPLLGNFYACALHDMRVHLDTAAPVRDDQGRTVAVLLLRTDPEKSLFKKIQSWPVPRQSAETALAQPMGNAVVFINTLRHSDAPPFSLRIPFSRGDVAAVQAATGDSGVRLRRDYRSVEVLSDIRSVPGTPWLLITKVDAAEVFHELRMRQRRVLAFVGLGIMMSGALVLVETHRRKSRLYENLFRAEQARADAEAESRIVLYSIGDAVVATDTNGNITRMNRVAEDLMGWTEAEALGQPLRDFFRISNETTGEPVDSPVDHVLREGIVVGLANHTVLTARNGSVIPIADSGAPIRNASGHITGVVLVFRDQSEERALHRALQERERRLSLLMSNLPGLAYTCDNAPGWPMRFVSEGCRALFGHEVAELCGPNAIPYEKLIHPDDRKRVWTTIQQAVAQSQPFQLEYRVRTRDGREKFVWEQGCPVQGTPEQQPWIEGFVTDITTRQKAEIELKARNAELEKFNRVAVGRELRMIELKREINALSHQMGMPPPYPDDVRHDSDASSANGPPE